MGHHVTKFRHALTLAVKKKNKIKYAHSRFWEKRHKTQKNKTLNIPIQIRDGWNNEDTVCANKNGHTIPQLVKEWKHSWEILVWIKSNSNDDANGNMNTWISLFFSTALHAQISLKMVNAKHHLVQMQTTLLSRVLFCEMWQHLRGRWMTQIHTDFTTGRYFSVLLHTGMHTDTAGMKDYDENLSGMTQGEI